MVVNARDSAPFVIIRLAYWRAAIRSTPCRDCGAAEGHGCKCGRPHGGDCGQCGCPASCHGFSGQLHLSRFNAWLRPTPAPSDAE